MPVAFVDKGTTRMQSSKFNFDEPAEKNEACLSVEVEAGSFRTMTSSGNENVHMSVHVEPV